MDEKIDALPPRVSHWSFPSASKEIVSIGFQTCIVQEQYLNVTFVIIALQDGPFRSILHETQTLASKPKKSELTHHFLQLFERASEFAPIK